MTLPTPQPAPTGLEYGGFWIRVVAYVIDWIILVVINAVLGIFGSAGSLLGSIVGIAYFIGLWGYRGQTVGMIPLNLYVVNAADGGKITWTQAVLRFIGLIISFIVIFIGVIWVAFDARKRGWHDMIANTVVVRRLG